MFQLLRRFPAVVKRRQLSLLMLFVLIAAAAVGIKYGLMPLLKQRARDAVLAKIESASGKWVDLDSPVRRRLLLQGKGIDDRLLQELASNFQLFPELVELDLFESEVTDVGWKSLLDSASHLETIVVFKNRISDAAIQAGMKQRSDLSISERQPDPVATGLAGTLIPPAAVISMLLDDAKLLLGSGEGKLHVVDLTGSRPTRSIDAHSNWLFDMAHSPTGLLLATVGGDNRIAIWRYPELEMLADVVTEGDVHGVAWLDEHHLASVGDDGLLHSWRLDAPADALTGAVHGLRLVEHETQMAHDKPIPRLAISADRSTLLTVSRDDRIGVWSVQPDATLVRVGNLIGHRDDCMDAAIGSNHIAASVGYDGKLKLWDLLKQECIQSLDIEDGRLFCLSVDWQNNIAFVGHEFGVTRVDLSSGDLLNQPQPYVAKIVQQGRRIVSSDGLGRVVTRSGKDLAATASIQIFEGRYANLSNFALGR